MKDSIADNVLLYLAAVFVGAAVGSMPPAESHKGQSKGGAIVSASEAAPNAAPREEFTPKGLFWHDKTQAARSDAAALQRRVLVHFWFDGCGPCAEMESKIFTDPRVRQKLAGWVLLKVDTEALGAADKTRGENWADAFGQPVQCPAECVMAPDGKITTGLLNPPRTVGEYLHYLERLEGVE